MYVLPDDPGRPYTIVVVRPFLTYVRLNNLCKKKNYFMNRTIIHCSMLNVA